MGFIHLAFQVNDKLLYVPISLNCILTIMPYILYDQEHQKVKRLFDFIYLFHVMIFIKNKQFNEISFRLSDTRLVYSMDNQYGRPTSRLDKYHSIVYKLMLIRFIFDCLISIRALYKLHCRRVSELKSSNSSTGHTSDQEGLSDDTDTDTYFPFNKSCTICRDRIKMPCCLPCGHIFCWECIYGYANNTTNHQMVKCPNCSSLNSINSIRPLYFIQNINT